MRSIIGYYGPAAALGAALTWSAIAPAQTVVVHPDPPVTPPAPAPVVVTQPAPPPQPVVVTPPPAPEPVVVNDTDRETVQREHVYRTRPSRRLLMSGLIEAGVPYIASIAVAATSEHDGDSDLYIPVVGPWLDLGTRGGCPSGTGGCGAEIGNKVLLVGDGILQGVGALQIVGAFIFPETVGITTIRTSSAGPSVTFTPAKVGGAGYGLSAVGQF